MRSRAWCCTHLKLQHSHTHARARRTQCSSALEFKARTVRARDAMKTPHKACKIPGITVQDPRRYPLYCYPDLITIRSKGSEIQQCTCWENKISMHLHPLGCGQQPAFYHHSGEEIQTVARRHWCVRLLRERVVCRRAPPSSRLVPVSFLHVPVPPGVSCPVLSQKPDSVWD